MAALVATTGRSCRLVAARMSSMAAAFDGSATATTSCSSRQPIAIACTRRDDEVVLAHRAHVDEDATERAVRSNLLLERGIELLGRDETSFDEQTPKLDVVSHPQIPPPAGGPAVLRAYRGEELQKQAPIDGLV